MPLIIATIFIAAYFYKMAENIGKSGVRWALAAFAVFTAIQIVVSICMFWLIPVIFGFDKSGTDNLRLGGFYLGLILGVAGLLGVNYLLNKVSDD